MISSLSSALKSLVTNWRIGIIGLIVTGFEGSMYCFVFNWTPVLHSETLPTPFGLVFAMFMMACMCGASTFALFGKNLASIHVVLPTLVIGLAALGIVALTL